MSLDHPGGSNIIKKVYINGKRRPKRNNQRNEYMRMIPPDVASFEDGGMWS